MSTLGSRFAEALATKDEARVAELLDPEVDFRALTPSRSWQADDPAGVLEILFSSWFEASDELEGIVLSESDMVGDREQVRYRFRGRNPDGPFVVEQAGYLAERDGRISWIRLVCSGMRPAV